MGFLGFLEFLQLSAVYGNSGNLKFEIINSCLTYDFWFSGFPGFLGFRGFLKNPEIRNSKFGIRNQKVEIISYFMISDSLFSGFAGFSGFPGLPNQKSEIGNRKSRSDFWFLSFWIFRISGMFWSVWDFKDFWGLGFLGFPEIINRKVRNKK